MGFLGDVLGSVGHGGIDLLKSILPFKRGGKVGMLKKVVKAVVKDELKGKRSKRKVQKKRK
jgi:hypothetical protein